MLKKIRLLAQKYLNDENGIPPLWLIAYPMIVSSASHSIIIFFDRLFLSKYSVAALAASLPAGVSSFMFLSFFFATLNYVNPLTAQYFGARKYKICGSVCWQGIYLAIISGIILILLIPLGFYLFSLIKTYQLIMPQIKKYFLILMCGSIFELINVSLAGFFAGIGCTRIVMTANVIGMLINLPLNWLLIFGMKNRFIQFDGLGISGAAIASVISFFVTSIILFMHYRKPEYHKKFSTNRIRKINWLIIKKIFRYGGQSGIESFLNISAFNSFVFIGGALGIVAQSSINIVFSWNLLAFLPLIGISIAVSSLVGRNMGAQNPSGAETAVNSALVVGILFISIVAFFYGVYPERLVDFFCKAQGNTNLADIETIIQIKNLASKMLYMTLFYLFADVLLVIFAGALRGAGDTNFLMVTSAAAHWFLLVLPTYLAVFKFHKDVIFVWSIFIIFSLILTIAYIIRYYLGIWKKIKVI